jgi:hypothetical protein
MKTVKPKYALGDGEKMHAEHPDTFWMPERKAREALKPGNMVKCMFTPLKVKKGLPGGDRMWVTIKAVREDGTYLGKLENCPTSFDAEPGDDVVFRPEHIIDINVDEADDDPDELAAKRSRLLAAVATMRTRH